MPPLKNLRQETFCLEWIKDHEDARAYKAAGYKCGTYNSAHVGSHNLLKSLKVKGRILELERDARALARRAAVKAAEKLAIDRAWVVGRLVENVDRSMQVVPVLDKKGHQTGVYQYEGGVANRGLELIGKDIGMFVEKELPKGDTYNIVNFYLPENLRDATNREPPTPIGNGHGDD